MIEAEVQQPPQLPSSSKHSVARYSLERSLIPSGDFYNIDRFGSLEPRSARSSPMLEENPSGHL